MLNIYKKFKTLTGCNYQDMADKIGTSRQYIHDVMGNYSIKHKTSTGMIMTCCINDKIKQLEKHIEELKEFRQEIAEQSLVKEPWR